MKDLRPTQTTIRMHQRGMSLVEALVALLVLSIGMLGIAALYVETTRANRTATIRTQAVGFVQDMADRIRANPVAQGNYDMDLYAGAPAKHNCVDAAGAAANCTQDELAEDDLAWWRAAVVAALPRSVPDVQYFAGTGAGRPDRYQISVTWTEPGDPPEQFSYESNIEFIAATP